MLQPDIPCDAKVQPAQFPIDNLAIVLVEPKTPGNVGSVARAMKVAGLSRLIVVNPERDPHSREAWWMAHGAEDVLRGAEIIPDLETVKQQLPAMVGTSHRHGKGRGAAYSPKRLAPKLVSTARREPLAILFGREDKGLANDELALCQWVIRVPTASTMPSLNLSQAVMVVAYELYVTSLEDAEVESDDDLTVAEIEALTDRVLGVIEQTPYRTHLAADQVRSSVRSMLTNSRLDIKDAQLMHGLCKAVTRQFERLE